MGTSKKRGNYENYQFIYLFYLRSSIISIAQNILPYFKKINPPQIIIVFALYFNREAR
jgi:hypothetical protein